MAELRTETRLIADLQAHPQNYRAHPPEQVSAIKASLTRLGQFRAVVVNTEDTILAGHGVVQAAQELGWTEITVHVFEGDEAEQRLVMVADNELSRKAEDDDQLLMELLRELDDLSGTGWTRDEVDAMVDAGLEPFEAPVETVTQEQAEYRWLIAFTVSEQEKVALEAVCAEYGGIDEETLREIILDRVVSKS
jgi:hypothetical protein